MGNTVADIGDLEERLKKSTDDPTRISLLNQLSEIYVTTRYQKAILYNQQAIKHATSTSNQKGLAKAFLIQGTLLNIQRKPIAAITAYKKSDSLYTRLVDMPNKVDVYSQLAQVFLEYQDTTQAAIYLEDALNIAVGNKYTNGAMSTTKLLGKVYIAQQKYTKADKILNDGINATAQLKSGKTKALGHLYVQFGRAYGQQKQYKKAIDLLQKGLKNSQEAKNPATTIRGLHYLGLVAQAEQQDQKAVNYFEQSIKVANDHQRKLLLSENYLHWAQILVQEDKSNEELNQGLLLAEKAYETTSNYSNPVLSQNAVKILLEAYTRQKKPAQVKEYQAIYQTLNDSIRSRANQKQLGLMAFQLKIQQQAQIEKIQGQHQAQINKTNNQKQWLMLILLVSALG